MNTKHKQPWALILGASSGFGAAVALELAEHGYNILGIHLDRKKTLPAVRRLIRQIEDHGRIAVYHNVNAADAENRKQILDEFVHTYHREGGVDLRVLFHSLAFGTLKPLVGRTQHEMISQNQLEMTLDVMANSLVYWTQAVVYRRLMRHGARILAMTSDGANQNLPYYGAVSAAKCALESYIRQLAMELGPRGITCNALLAGVTDTPALNKIPGAENMLFAAMSKNPFGRATTPEDIARAVSLLIQPGAGFINGNTIGVDGGESKISYIGQRNPWQYTDLSLLEEKPWEPTDIS